MPMTYKELLSLTQSYLTGDNKVPTDPDVRIVVLEDALIEVADRAAVMRLTTKVAGETLRLGPGNSLLVRFPNLPGHIEEEIDIDHELGGPVARFMAATWSSNDKNVAKHLAAAERRILNYNAKVYATLDSVCIDDSCGVIETTTQYTQDPTWG